jgi:hypothetical protein
MSQLSHNMDQTLEHLRTAPKQIKLREMEVKLNKLFRDRMEERQMLFSMAYTDGMCNPSMYTKNQWITNPWNDKKGSI